MRWKVEVRGHPFDLEHLKQAVGGLRGRVLSKDGKNYLYTEDFEVCETAQAAHCRAQECIKIIDTVLGLYETGAQIIELGPVIDNDGRMTHFVNIVGTASGRASAGAVSVTMNGAGTLPTPPRDSPFAKSARVISLHPEVARAVDELMKPDKTFSSLWRAYEIVKGDLGLGDQKRGFQRAAALSGIDKQELDNFVENANHPELGGSMSRHAGRKDDRRPPASGTSPMDYATAKGLIHRVVRDWIESKW